MMWLVCYIMAGILVTSRGRRQRLAGVGRGCAELPERPSAFNQDLSQHSIAPNSNGLTWVTAVIHDAW